MLAVDKVTRVGPTNITSNDLLRCIYRLIIEKIDCLAYTAGSLVKKKVWRIALLNMYPTQDMVVPGWLSEVLLVELREA